MIYNLTLVHLPYLQYHRDENIDTYATNISNSILAIASECIPNKSITVKPSDPPWITSGLKRQIRKRRRAYRKAKATNQSHHWAKFKRLRNEAPEYLSSLIPQQVNDISRYNLRNSNNIRTIRAKTNQYNNSFFALYLKRLEYLAS